MAQLVDLAILNQKGDDGYLGIGYFLRRFGVGLTSQQQLVIPDTVWLWILESYQNAVVTALSASNSVGIVLDVVVDGRSEGLIVSLHLAFKARNQLALIVLVQKIANGTQVAFIIRD